MPGGLKGKGDRPLVLLVDDAADNRAMYAEYLAFDGFRVLEADNGVQAVATAQRESPDAIVMDVMLPGMDGLEATRLLRQREATKKVIVLALSGRGERELEERAVAAGVDFYCRKPCLPNELAAHLRALLGARRSR